MMKPNAVPSSTHGALALDTKQSDPQLTETGELGEPSTPAALGRSDEDEGNTPTAKRTIRVLIADDHPIVRDGLRRLLSLDEDIEVVGEAGDGREVLERVQALEPDVLLLDLRMPNMDGLTALQTLQHTNRKTRVIVLTASEDKNEFVQAMKLGCSGIVLKQTAPDLIAKSIRKVHSGEIWLDSHTTAAVMRQFATPGEAMAAASGGKSRERSPLSTREREIVVVEKPYSKKVNERRASIISAKVGSKTQDNLFVLREIKGPKENPSELTIELVEGGIASVNVAKPFTKVMGYSVDLRHELEKKEFLGKRVDETFTLDNVVYKIVAITKDEVVVSDPSSKRTIIRAASLRP